MSEAGKTAEIPTIDTPKPAFTRSTGPSNHGGLLPPSRKQADYDAIQLQRMLPPGIAPEAESNEPSAPPEPSSGGMADLFKLTRSKGVFLAGLGTLAAVYYGLDQFLPKTMVNEVLQSKSTDTPPTTGKDRISSLPPLMTLSPAPTTAPHLNPENHPSPVMLPPGNDTIRLARSDAPVTLDKTTVPPTLPSVIPAPPIAVPTPSTPAVIPVLTTPTPPAASPEVRVAPLILPGSDNTKLDLPKDTSPIPDLSKLPVVAPSVPPKLEDLKPVTPITPKIETPKLPDVKPEFPNFESVKPVVAPVEAPKPITPPTTSAIPPIKILPAAPGTESAPPAAIPIKPPVTMTPELAPSPPPTVKPDIMPLPTATTETIPPAALPVVPKEIPLTPKPADSVVSVPVKPLDKPAGTPGVTALPTNVSEPKTDYDVDIHRVRERETYEVVSEKYYGNNRYANALRQYNQSADLSRVREVQVPPLTVIRKLADQLPAAKEVVPAGVGAATEDSPNWGRNVRGRGTETTPEIRYEKYLIPRRGMTMRDVAKAVYGAEKEWPRVDNRHNIRFRPDEELPVGAELIVPVERVDWR